MATDAGTIVSYPGESQSYRAARDELLRAEIDLRRRTEAVARQRRVLPPGGQIPRDYAFTGLAGDAVSMSELFAGGQDTLIIYSLMFGPQDERPCPSCSSIADGLDGAARHIAERASLVIAAMSSPERIRDLVVDRGWTALRFVSTAGTTYNRDYHAETAEGAQMPMLNVFTRSDGRIRHFWGSELISAPVDPDQDERHVDAIWPIWALADVTPEGRPGGGDWSWPALDYP